MKSKTYSDKSRGMLRKGQLWLPALIGIGFLIVFPVAELIQFGNWAGLGLKPEELALNYERWWRETLLYIGLAVVFSAAVINAVNSFWYLYSSAKVDFYHCLPVSRKRMFTEKTLTGIWFYLIPYGIMEFLAVCIGAARGFFSLELMGLAVKMLVIHLVMYLMAYFAVVLAVCLTGNNLTGALTTAGIFGYGPVLAFLLNGYSMEFFRTYSGRPVFGGWRFLLQCSPFALSIEFIGRYGAKASCTLYFLLLILVTAALAAVSCTAYLKRPMESAGKSVVYPFVERIMNFMVVIPAGLGVGLIFYVTPTGGYKAFWWVFGLVLGTVLAHGMLQVIFRLDFRSFFSRRLSFGISAVCVALCALVFRMDLTGYDSYLPAFEKLEGIAVETVNNHEYGWRVEETGDGSYRLIPEMEETGRNLSMSPEIYQALEQIVKNPVPAEQNSYRRYLDVKFGLKSGKEVYRRYTPSCESYKALKKALYDTGNLKESRYSFLRTDLKYLHSVSGEFWDNRNYALFQNDSAKQRELTEALRADAEEADSSMLFELPCAQLQFSCSDMPVEQRDGTVAINGGYDFAVYVYPGFKRTVAILKETGYPLSIDELELESASYTVYQTVNNNWNELMNATVEEPDRLEELKQAMIPYGLFPEWMEYEENLQMEVQLADNGGSSSMRMVKDRVPAFIREQMENAGIFGDPDAEYAETGVQVDYEE